MLSVKICNLLQFDNTTVLIINNRVKVPSSKIFFSNFYDITKPNKKVNYLRMYFIYIYISGLLRLVKIPPFQ